MNWCILIPIIISLVSALLGGLIGCMICRRKAEEKENSYNASANLHNAWEGKYNDLYASHQTLLGDLKNCKNENATIKSELEAAIHSKTRMETDLNTCKAAKSELEAEIAKLKGKLLELEENGKGLSIIQGDLTACMSSKSELEAEVAKLKGKLSECGENVNGLSLQLAAFATPPEPDDLKIVEGIGPKIEELLNKGGIYTFKQLADAPIERLQRILDEAGPRFQMHNPGTWPEQSRLCYEGKWDELKKLQDELKGGRPD